jgi:hypothetical protein
LQITPYAHQIVELLPPLWAASEEDHLFKSTILVTLTKLMGVSYRVLKDFMFEISLRSNDLTFVVTERAIKSPLPVCFTADRTQRLP